MDDKIDTYWKNINNIDNLKKKIEMKLIDTIVNICYKLTKYLCRINKN